MLGVSVLTEKLLKKKKKPEEDPPPQKNTEHLSILEESKDAPSHFFAQRIFFSLLVFVTLNQ